MKKIGLRVNCNRVSCMCVRLHRVPSISLCSKYELGSFDRTVDLNFDHNFDCNFYCNVDHKFDREKEKKKSVRFGDRN